MNIVYIIFTAVLVVSVIIGTYIHASGFKYATEGSASLLLGTAITGFISVCYYLDTGSALTPAALRLPDAVFFQVSDTSLQYRASTRVMDLVDSSSSSSLCAVRHWQPGSSAQHQSPLADMMRACR